MAVVRQRGGPGTGGAGARVGTTTTTTAAAAAAAAGGDVAKPPGGRVAWLLLLLLLLLLLGVLLGAHLHIAWARVGETRETAQRAADASVELARRVREVVSQLEPLRVSVEGTRRDLHAATARLDAADSAASDSLASLERRLAVDIAAFARELQQEQLRREELRREVEAAASWRERVDAETSDAVRRLLAVEELGDRVAAWDDGLRPRLEELSGGLESLRRAQQAGVERLERLESAAGEGGAERRALAERLSSLVAAAAEERRERDADASRELGALRAALDAAALRWEEARGRAEAALDGARRDVDGLRRTAEDHEGRLGEVAEAVTALEERAAESGEGEAAGEAAGERLGRLEERLAVLEEARGREDGGSGGAPGAEVAAEVEELRVAVGDAVERVRAAEERWRGAAESAGDRLRELVSDAVAQSEERLAAELEARIAEVAAAASAAQRERRSPGDDDDAGDEGGEEEPAGVSLGSLREELRRVTEQLAAVQSAVLEDGAQ